LKSDAARPVTYFTEPTGINYILPTVTKPFDLKEKATKEPIWNETILFNESYLHLLQPAVIVLFEIIDVYTTLEQIKKYLKVT
jgi:jouberin